MKELGTVALLLVLLTGSSGSTGTLIYGIWKLNAYITCDYVQTGFDQQIVIRFDRSGDYLLNPHKPAPEKRKKTYRVEGDLLFLCQPDGDPKSPQSVFRILKLTVDILHLRLLETGGKPVREHQRIEYLYHRDRTISHGREPERRAVSQSGRWFSAARAAAF